MNAPTPSSPSRVAVVSAEAQRGRRIAAAVESLGSSVCVTRSTVADLPSGAAAPDVVLIAAGEDRGIDCRAVSELRERLPEARLVVVLPGENGQDRRAVAIGADGIVYESGLDRVLGPALAALASGLAVLPCELNTGRQSPTLSAREKQVLAMVVMGFSNGEIAAKLYLAESTVKSHLSSSFRKLGVSSRKDAAARILDPDSGLGPGILAISGDGVGMTAGVTPERNGNGAAGHPYGLGARVT